jgi:hypothetical protein
MEYPHLWDETGELHGITTPSPRRPEIFRDVGQWRSEYESFGPEVWEKKHAENTPFRRRLMVMGNKCRDFEHDKIQQKHFQNWR